MKSSRGGKNFAVSSTVDFGGGGLASAGYSDIFLAKFKP